MTTPETDPPGDRPVPGARVDGPSGDPSPRRGRLTDLAAVLSFVALGFWVTGRLWLHPRSGVRDNPSDQSQFEWMMAHGARVVTHFAYPFGSDQMNVPDGVNLMANTSVLSISLPMTPVTMLLGPRAAFLLF